MASVTIAVLLVAVVFWALRQPGQRVAAPSAPATASNKPPLAPGVPRLAILPLENLSPNPQDAFFADGLHEELLTTVAERLAGVEVISRTTMMRDRKSVV